MRIHLDTNRCVHCKHIICKLIIVEIKFVFGNSKLLYICFNLSILVAFTLMLFASVPILTTCGCTKLPSEHLCPRNILPGMQHESVYIPSNARPLIMHYFVAADCRHCRNASLLSTHSAARHSSTLWIAIFWRFRCIFHVPLRTPRVIFATTTTLCKHGILRSIFLHFYLTSVVWRT